MIGQDLLPHNATAFEKSMSLSIDALQRMGGGVDTIETLKFKQPFPSQFLKTILAERGLDLLGAFVTEPELLLEHGTEFYRLLGTAQAVMNGLDLIGYDGNLMEAKSTRARWNTFQIGLYRVRDNETPDLDRISGVAELASPERSKFMRGWSGYNVPACVTSRNKTSRSLTSTDSGVTLRTGGPRWSFGRTYDYTYQPTQAELEFIGIWVAPSALSFTWDTFPFPASYATFPWGTIVNAVRKSLMARAMSEMSIWVNFNGPDGHIGCRKAKAIHLVNRDAGGSYSVGAQNYVIGGPGSEEIYIEALTDFGDGDGQTATTASLLFGAQPSDPARQGERWLNAADLDIPHPGIVSRPVSIKFGKTVRERIRTALRIVN